MNYGISKKQLIVDQVRYTWKNQKRALLWEWKDLMKTNNGHSYQLSQTEKLFQMMLALDYYKKELNAAEVVVGEPDL